MCFGELNELNCSALWEQTYYECVFIANSIGIEVGSQNSHKWELKNGSGATLLGPIPEMRGRFGLWNLTKPELVLVQDFVVTFSSGLGLILLPRLLVSVQKYKWKMRLDRTGHYEIKQNVLSLSLSLVV